MADVGAVILAAGLSSRFSGARDATKAAALFRGKPMVRHVAEAALASRARPVIVVLGHAAQTVKDALEGLDVRFVDNRDYRSGLASSLKGGIAALPDASAGCVVLLADMPRVSARLVDRLILAFAAHPGAAATAPVFAGRRGNPVLISQSLFPSVRKLKGDEGAKRLIGQLARGLLVEIEADDAVHVDFDTAEALADYEEKTNR